MTLRIHRAERTDLLADGLAELLARPLDDPFAEEVVVVPARGVERWLTRDGRPIWHEGLEPDVKVTLPDTVTPLLPDDIRDLTPVQLSKASDTQVLKALDLLKGEG